MKSKKPISVIVADDHMIVRRGIVSLLSLNPAFHVVGEAADGRSAVELSTAHEPDVIVMDISMPEMNGLEATRQIKSMTPRVKVLVLSAYDNPDYVSEILQSGANGYLLKNTTPDELYAAVSAVHNGNAFFSPSISKIILDNYLQHTHQEPPPAVPPKTPANYSGPLTAREQEILRLVAEGKPHLQIAKILHISIRTVDTHRNNIMKKLNLHDTASLVTYAIREGLMEMPK
jgi:two-component system response regulator NreC